MHNGDNTSLLRSTSSRGYKQRSHYAGKWRDQKFDPDKLKTNALTSIRLGVEDFTRSQLTEGGDPDRALSALRNLFAGILLLFKYRIATEAGDHRTVTS